MDKLYVVVTSTPKEKVKMNVKYTQKEVVELVGVIACNPDDPRTIERVFSVDDEGNIEHFEVVFRQGKLQVVAREYLKQEGELF